MQILHLLRSVRGGVHRHTRFVFMHVGYHTVFLEVIIMEYVIFKHKLTL